MTKKSELSKDIRYKMPIGKFILENYIGEDLRIDIRIYRESGKPINTRDDIFITAKGKMHANVNIDSLEHFSYEEPVFYDA